MPIRLGSLFAFVLCLFCLGINIAYFPVVRQSFLGSGESPVAAHPALSAAEIADFYPSDAAKTESVKTEPAKIEPENVPVPLKKEPKKQEPVQQPEILAVDPSLLPAAPVLPLPEQKQPKPKPAAAQPAVGKEYKPAVPVKPETKPSPQRKKPAAKPSSQAEWGTAESVLTAPIRYD